MSADQKKKLNYLFFLTVTAVLVYLTFRFLLPFVLPFLFAYWTAKLLIPLVTLIEKRIRLPKSIGSTLVLTAFFALLGTGTFFLLRTLLFQLEAFLKNMPIYQQLLTTGMNSVCNGCDSFFNLSAGSTHRFVTANIDYAASSVQKNIMPALTEQAWDVILRTAGFLGSLFFVFLSALMIITDIDKIKTSYQASLLYQDIHAVLSSLGMALAAYFRMQGIIISIIACILTVGFFIIGNEYALLLGIFIAVFDAFPILGSGLILLPWAAFRLLAGDIFTAAILATLYCICQLIRQTMEPRLLGDRLGVLPLYTLMSIYIGIKLYGIAGVFLGPLTLVTIQAILSNYRQSAKL